jgi:hypothetical protein
MSKKEYENRSIQVIQMGGGGEQLKLSKVTAIGIKGKQMLHLDQLDDGTWRLIYSKEIIPDIQKVLGFNIKRF